MLFPLVRLHVDVKADVAADAFRPLGAARDLELLEL